MTCVSFDPLATLIAFAVISSIPPALESMVINPVVAESLIAMLTVFVTVEFAGTEKNAGGVATSGLEMSQNSLRMNWTREEVDNKLKQIMTDIHNSCIQYGKDEDGYIDYVRGANIAGFVKVADAMLAQGVV